MTISYFVGACNRQGWPGFSPLRMRSIVSSRSACAFIDWIRARRRLGLHSSGSIVDTQVDIRQATPASLIEMIRSRWVTADGLAVTVSPRHSVHAA